MRLIHFLEDSSFVFKSRQRIQYRKILNNGQFITPHHSSHTCHLYCIICYSSRTGHLSSMLSLTQCCSPDSGHLWHSVFIYASSISITNYSYVIYHTRYSHTSLFTGPGEGGFVAWPISLKVTLTQSPSQTIHVTCYPAHCVASHNFLFIICFIHLILTIYISYDYHLLPPIHLILC